jgi:hypothetical protein
VRVLTSAEQADLSNLLSSYGLVFRETDEHWKEDDNTACESEK